LGPEVDDKYLEDYIEFYGVWAYYLKDAASRI
jgi:hypothetical protein